MHFSKDDEDERFMARALFLAREAVGLASPNPTVGCVLMRDGIVLGEGAHRYDLLDHAEIVALKQALAAGIDLAGATAYVTLEPCSHHGRTGPCADALIAARIARCVIATADPNPQVSGSGIAKLRAAGIMVTLGPVQASARALNNAFALSITQGRPFVTLKAALSVDGMLAPAHRTSTAPYWLTGAESRAEVHRLRHASDAILTGIGPVLAADPLLTDRSGLSRRRPLMRVVLDSTLRLPTTAKLVQTAHQDLWIFCGPEAPSSARKALESLGARVTELSTTANQLSTPELRSTLNLSEILSHLHAAQIQSVLLEAGSALNVSFLNADLVDQAVLFYAPTELGPDAIPFAHGTVGPYTLQQRLISVNKQPFGADVCVSGLLHNPWASIAPLV